MIETILREPDGPVAFDTDHNVYILGAGFSAEAGFPVMSDFMQQMRVAAAAMRSPEDDGARRAIEGVLRFRQQAAAAAYRVKFDADNVEELFSLASVDPAGPMTSSMRRALCATLAHAHRRYRTVSSMRWYQLPWGVNGALPSGWDRVNAMPGRTARVDADRMGVMVGSMLGWSDGSVHGTNTFITFNYDVLLEDALGSLGVSVDLGLRPATGAESGAPTVQVLKLHGSVDWGQDEGDVVQRVVGDDGKSAPFTGGEASEAFVVPPTWRKSFGGLEEVWRRATRALQTATRIVVIGFSMPETDLHFKYLLARALMSNVSLQSVSIVGPHARGELTQRRLRGILSDPDSVRCFPIHASEYFAPNMIDPEIGRRCAWHIDNPGLLRPIEK